VKILDFKGFTTRKNFDPDIPVLVLLVLLFLDSDVNFAGSKKNSLPHRRVTPIARH
jgi:hypothetical protein